MAAIVAVVFMIGCGEGSEAETSKAPAATTSTSTTPAAKPPSKAPTKKPHRKLRFVEVTVNGHFGGENVGIVMADQLGYFQDVGLSVSVYDPILPRRPSSYLGQGIIDLAVTQQPQVVLSQAKGNPIVAVASVIPTPTAAMIWLDDADIDEIADLEGKTIGVPGVPFQKDFLEPVLAQGGLTLDDVKVRESGYELISDLIAGRTDAIFGGSANIEGAELEYRGLEPVVTEVQDLGIPPYEELVLAAREDFLAKKPKLIRGFVAAMSRGTAAAVEDPDAATRAILEVSEGGLPGPIRAGVEATLPLLSASGEMDREQAGGLISWMLGEGLLERKVPTSAVLNDDYVGPSQG